MLSRLRPFYTRKRENMIFHRNQTVNFRTNAFPLSGASVPFLLKNRYLSLNVGELFEYVADLLWELTAVRTSSSNFTLVNVTSPFSKYSHGSSHPPPFITRPGGNALILTFATTMRQDYDQDQELSRQDVRHHSIHSTQWGQNMKLEFVSISLSLTQAHSMGLINLQSNQLQYIYNLIGGMTKSLVRHQSYYLVGTDTYEEAHAQLNLVATHSKISRMPLPQLFQTIPYPLWVFSEVLWGYAPNVLSQRIITSQAALYYFMYLTSIVHQGSAVVGDVTVKRLGLGLGNKRGIMGYLAQSLLSFVQLVKSPQDSTFTPLELIAPSVIQAVVATGKSKIDARPSYVLDFAEGTKTLVQALQVHALEGDLGDLLMPPETVAYKLMHEDRRFSDRLVNALDFSVSESASSEAKTLALVPTVLDDIHSPTTTLVKMALTMEHRPESRWASRYSLDSAFGSFDDEHHNKCHAKVLTYIMLHPEDADAHIVFFGNYKAYEHSILVSADGRTLVDVSSDIGAYLPGVGYVVHNMVYTVIKDITVDDFISRFFFAGKKEGPFPKKLSTSRSRLRPHSAQKSLELKSKLPRSLSGRAAPQ